MATAPTTTKPLSVVLDANFVIAFCSKEPGTYPKAKAELDNYTATGCRFFAPGVLIAEALFVFCRKLQDSLLTTTEHGQAVSSLIALMAAINPPPTGDASLVRRAEEIRATYGCNRSADGIYLALAEQLTAAGPAEIVTFDNGLATQATANAPTVTVKLLTP